MSHLMYLTSCLSPRLKYPTVNLTFALGSKSTSHLKLNTSNTKFRMLFPHPTCSLSCFFLSSRNSTTLHPAAQAKTIYPWFLFPFTLHLIHQKVLLIQPSHCNPNLATSISCAVILYPSHHHFLPGLLEEPPLQLFLFLPPYNPFTDTTRVVLKKKKRVH